MGNIAPLYNYLNMAHTGSSMEYSWRAGYISGQVKTLSRNSHLPKKKIVFMPAE